MWAARCGTEKAAAGVDPHPTTMHDTTDPKSETTPPPDPGGNRSSKVLLIIIVGIVLAIFLAFLIFRPRSADGATLPAAQTSSPVSP